MLPTDADFNASTRAIQFKVDIYLNGATASPLSITRENYLIDVSLLEEATSGDTPFDNVSSNEISITLYSPNGIFNPVNTSSTYYGKMKRNVLLKPYVRTSDTQDWAQLGTFYITDWSAAMISTTATVVADDILYDIYDKKMANLQVQRNMTVSAFITAFFATFSVVPVVATTVTESLTMAYINKENKDCLTQIMSAFLLSCNVAHNGSLQVRSLSTPQSVRAVLTDSNQVMAVSTNLSINSDYDAAYLTYYVPSESDSQELLNIANTGIASGNSTLTYELSKTPLVRLKYVSVNGLDALCKVTAATCTSNTATLTINNPDTEGAICNIVINGTTVDKAAHSLGSEGQNTLKIDNEYIQNGTHATSYLTMMQRFISSHAPVITVQIRGNPLLEIGDKIRVQSTRDNIDFTGILMRQDYKYDGGLSSEITLLDASLVEEVST